MKEENIKFVFVFIKVYFIPNVHVKSNMADCPLANIWF